MLSHRYEHGDHRLMLEPPPAQVMVLPEAPPSADATKNLSLTLPPLGQSCQASNSEEIVVCGRRNDNRYRFGPQLPDAPMALDDIKDLVNTNIGPVQIKPGGVHSLASTGNGIELKIPF